MVQVAIYSLSFIKDEVQELLRQGLISRHQSIYTLRWYIPNRDWDEIELELERNNFLSRDRIIDLIDNEEWWVFMEIHALAFYGLFYGNHGFLPVLILAIIMTFSCFRCRPHGKCCCCLGNLKVKKHYIKISNDDEEIRIHYRIDDS